MSEHDKLLCEIEAFLLRSGIGQTRFGVEAMGDRSLVTRLRSGKSVTLKSADRIRRYMRDNAKKKHSSASVAA